MVPSVIDADFEVEVSGKLEDVVKNSIHTSSGAPLYLIQLSDIRWINANYAMCHGLEFNYYGDGKDNRDKIDEVLKDKENYRLTDHMKDFTIVVQTNDMMEYRIDVGRWMYPVPVPQILGSRDKLDIPHYEESYYPDRHNPIPQFFRRSENEHLKLISIFYPEDGYVKVTAAGGYVWLEAQNNDTQHPHLNKTFVIQLNEYYLDYIRFMFYEDKSGYWGSFRYCRHLGDAWSADNLFVRELYNDHTPENKKFGINPIITDKPDHYMDPWLKGSKYSYVNGIPEEENERIKKEEQAKAEKYWQDREKARRSILSVLFKGDDLDAMCEHYRRADAEVFGRKNTTKAPTIYNSKQRGFNR